MKILLELRDVSAGKGFSWPVAILSFLSYIPVCQEVEPCSPNSTTFVSRTDSSCILRSSEIWEIDYWIKKRV